VKTIQTEKSRRVSTCTLDNGNDDDDDDIDYEADIVIGDDSMIQSIAIKVVKALLKKEREKQFKKNAGNDIDLSSSQSLSPSSSSLSDEVNTTSTTSFTKSSTTSIIPVVDPSANQSPISTTTITTTKTSNDASIPISSIISESSSQSSPATTSAFKLGEEIAIASSIDIESMDTDDKTRKKKKKLSFDNSNNKLEDYENMTFIDRNGMNSFFHSIARRKRMALKTSTSTSAYTHPIYELLDGTDDDDLLIATSIGSSAAVTTTASESVTDSNLADSTRSPTTAISSSSTSTRRSNKFGPAKPASNMRTTAKKNDTADKAAK
jgi:hypothetical protein